MKRRLRKIADYFTAASFVLIVILMAAWLGRVGEMEYAGEFRVMDGDSLVLGETRFRLEGIDAPEYRQDCTRNGSSWPCGRDAAQFLRRQMRDVAVVCRGLGRDKYERILARCYSGGRDINRQMVENGWAVAFGDYEGAEASARSRQRGIWSGDFIPPREWRDLHASTIEEASGHGIVTRIMAWIRGWL